MKKKKVVRKRAVPKQSSETPIIITALIILLVLAGATTYYFMRPQQNVTVERIESTVATVNGHPISAEQLSFQYNLLPQAYKEEFDKEEVLEQIIDEEVIVQAAARQGITATPGDIHSRVQEIMERNQLSVEDLQENLNMLNFTTEEFERLIARQITIERYLNKTITIREPDDASLLVLYESTKDQYAVDEQVTVRHILISLQREDAAVIAKRIYDELKVGSSFCELVANSSDDRGSREICGEYTFSRGFMVPEFEKASFDMQNNELRLIQTQFGYHIIEKLNATPAGVKSFSDVKDLLRDSLLAQDRAVQYRTLVADLRSSATISYPNGTSVLPAQAGGVIAPAQPSEPVLIEEDTVYACISRDTTLYGTSWNTDTQEALELFAVNKADLRYIDCTENSECSWIKGYPTWIIDGREYIGKMSLEQLRVASDC